MKEKMREKMREKYILNIHKLWNMNFGFLIFPGLEELDLAGPWEMISLWSKFGQESEKCLMVAENSGPVICNKIPQAPVYLRKRD